MLLNTASCTVYTQVISGTWLRSADFQPFVSTRATSSSIILFSPVSILRIIYMHIRGAKDAVGPLQLSTSKNRPLSFSFSL